MHNTILCCSLSLPCLFNAAQRDRESLNEDSAVTSAGVRKNRNSATTAFDEHFIHLLVSTCSVLISYNEAKSVLHAICTFQRVVNQTRLLFCQCSFKSYFVNKRMCRPINYKLFTSIVIDAPEAMLSPAGLPMPKKNRVSATECLETCEVS